MGVVAEENFLLLICLIPASSVERVCLHQSLPDSQMPPCTLPRSKNEELTGKVADSGCRGVHSHQQKKKSTKDQCEFLACLNFSLCAQHFGINGEHFRLMFLHPIVLYLLTKLGWQWKQHKEDPNKLLNPLSQGCPVGAERATQLLRGWARQKDHHSGRTDMSVRKFSLWAHQITSQKTPNSYRR